MLDTIPSSESNIELQIADEAILEQVEHQIDAFVIDNDAKAEWAIKKIKGEEEETNRYIAVCELMIQEYSLKIEKAKERLENRTSYLKSQLYRYFHQIPHRETKTQSSYRLPSGTLKLKHQQPEFQRDEEVLVKWLKDRGRLDLVTVVEKAKWADLKKSITVAGDVVVDPETGEIVEGIQVVERTSVFEVEITT